MPVFFWVLIGLFVVIVIIGIVSGFRETRPTSQNQRSYHSPQYSDPLAAYEEIKQREAQEKVARETEGERKRIEHEDKIRVDHYKKFRCQWPGCGITSTGPSYTVEFGEDWFGSENIHHCSFCRRYVCSDHYTTYDHRSNAYGCCKECYVKLATGRLKL